MSWIYTLNFQNMGLGAVFTIQVGGIGSEGEYTEPYASHEVSDSNASDFAEALINDFHSFYPNVDDSAGNTGWSVSVTREDHTAVE